VRLGLAFHAAALGAAVLLVTSGCGSGAKEGPIATGDGDDPNPTASASPTLKAPEVPPATDDEQGRRAFATWFVQALAYANRSNDATPIVQRSIEDPKLSCSVCDSFEKFLADRQAKGISYQPSTYDVKRIFKTGQQEGAVIYDLIASEPASRDVKQDGTVVKRYPANARQLIEVGIRFHDGAYEITGWKVGQGATG
jgi:hypothetical protein